MNVLIVDDEQRASDGLTQLITTYCQEIGSISSVSSLSSAELKIKHIRPDILFLDVELGDQKSFELFSRIPLEEIPVIFTTGHQKYAVEAFRLSAVDFLLKPVDPDLLQEAVARAKSKLGLVDQENRLATLIHNVSAKRSQEQKLVINTSEATYIWSLSDILYCESKANYTKFYHVDSRRVMVSQTLSNYDKQLGSYDFFRTHKSFLVNLHHIDRYDKREGGKVILKNGHELPLAERRRDDFLQLVKKLALK
ncbi:MAG: LytTR family DNA-binding domain-containing protein [Bacteroidota bacterium]